MTQSLSQPTNAEHMRARRTARRSTTELDERSAGNGHQAPGGDLVTVRRLAYADLPQVIAIERRAFPTPWSLAMFVLELSKPSGICLAAVRDGRVVGYAVCSRYDRVWHLMNIAVEPQLRRVGIATAMLRHLFEEADGPEAQYTLEVRLSNHPAIAMYERFGFRAAGRRRGYYHDNREDAMIMWRAAGEGELVVPEPA
jgi:ribosomal-protein-alanine N-acetyltransferase